MLVRVQGAAAAGTPGTTAPAAAARPSAATASARAFVVVAAASAAADASVAAAAAARDRRACRPGQAARPVAQLAPTAAAVHHRRRWRVRRLHGHPGGQLAGVPVARPVPTPPSAARGARRKFGRQFARWISPAVRHHTGQETKVSVLFFLQYFRSVKIFVRIEMAKFSDR